PRQALRAGGVAGPGSGAPPKDRPERRRRAGPAAVRRPRAGSTGPRGVAGRAEDRAHPDRVQPAAAVHVAPRPRPHARLHLRPGVGIRLRPSLELARGLRWLPAPEDRSRRRAPAHPHDPRRRIRAAGARVTFRARLTLVATVAVAMAILIASCVIYLIVRGQLRGQVDGALRSRLQAVSYTVGPGTLRINFPDLPLGGASGYAQLVNARGTSARQEEGRIRLPVTDRVEAVAAGREPAFFQDAVVAGLHVRILTARIGPGWAVELA